MASQVISGKESACNAGDMGLIPGLGRSPRGGNGDPLQYFCLGNPMNRGVLWAIIHGVAKNRTPLSYLTRITFFFFKIFFLGEVDHFLSLY